MKGWSRRHRGVFQQPVITAELNQKLNQFAQKINQVQQLSTNFMLLDSLFPNEDINSGAYQPAFSSSETQYQLNRNNYQANSQLALLNTTEPADGVFAFFLKLPSFIFNLKNIFYLSLIGLFITGILKALKFFLNNTW